MESDQRDVLIARTTKIVAAHLTGNLVETKDIPGVITTVFRALETIATHGAQSAQPAGQRQAANLLPPPAVPIEESIRPDHIICLEDGKPMKVLTRHLKALYGLTPAQYRARWRLPGDYPMVAPAYSEQRSVIAKSIGLGARRRKKAKNVDPQE